MLSAFQHHLRHACAYQGEAPLWLAVSGGLDSVAMAWLFHRAGLDFSLLHMNFSLRGRESDEDEVFVRALGVSMGREVRVKRVDTRAYTLEKGISIQEAARELRYQWFTEVCAAESGLVAVAHHRDDELETFFINLLRGTGLKGLTGYAARSGNILRPMLFTGRRAIEAWARKEGIRWREDSSNSSDKYLRNRIRHDLLPLLEDLRPGSRDKMLENIARLASEEALLNTFIGRPEGEGDKEFRLAVPLGMPSEALPAFLASVLGPLGFPFSMMLPVAQALHGNEGKRFHSPTHELSVSRGGVRVRPVQPVNEEVYIIVDVDDVSSLPIPLRMEYVSREEIGLLDQGPDVALLDAARLQWPLRLRRRREGDRFHPPPGTGSKTVSDFLIDQKINPFVRDKLWLLESAGHIVWVVGYRLDHRYRLSDRTEEVIRIEVGQRSAY